MRINIYIFLFVADRDVGRGQMIAPPFALNDAIVSKIDRFKAIGSKCLEAFFDKSRIEMFVDKPASISFKFAPFFFGHGLPVLPTLFLDVFDFVTDGLGVCVVFEVERRGVIANAWFPELEDVGDSVFFLSREHVVESSHFDI